jgi:hypothetical protein
VGFAVAACKAQLVTNILCMRIAQIAPLTEAIPPKLYGGTERVISWLADELVALGHDVVCSRAGIRKPRPTWRRAGRRHCVSTARSATPMRCICPCSSESANGLMISMCSTFISITIHSPYFPVSRHHSSPRSMADSTCRRHQVVFATFPSIPVISISDAQRRPVPGAGWIRTIHHGMPERLLTPQPSSRIVELLHFARRERSITFATPSMAFTRRDNVTHE